MNINEYGAVFVSPEELFDAVYAGKIKQFDNLYLNNSEEIQKFNLGLILNFDNIPKLKEYQKPEESLDFFDEANQCDWFMPKEYLEFPLEKWLLDRCNTDKEKQRIQEELNLFIQHGMFDLLFYLKYLVDTMRKNNIVWGVGRGSSVASYVLYHIGVHRIDSLKYNLDITEFLKPGENNGKI